MRIDNYKSSVKLSQKAAFEFLENPHNFEKLMPEELTFFEADDTGFSFQLSGIPVKIILKKKQAVAFSNITYQSEGKINFELKAQLSKIEEEKTEITFAFEGELNPMIRMMAEKPLKKLLEVFSTQIAQL